MLSPDGSGSGGDAGLDTCKVAGETHERRTPRKRKRTRKQRTLRRIHAKARDRQIAWTEGQPATAEALTIELNGRDDEPNGGLYGELRDERRGNPGQPYQGRSASFVSPPTKSPKPWRGER